MLKGHRHQPAIWRIGAMTLADVGALTDPAAPCAAVVDARAATITPLAFAADGTVVALAPQPY